MEVKAPKSFNEQLEILKNRGCIITDEEFAKQKLQQINYYRLTAYFLPFKNKDGTYIDGTSFDKVYRIYEFDRKLRILLFGVVEEIELMFRTQLSYFHSMKYGALGYNNAENFNKKHNIERFKSHLEKSISQNKEQFFVKHHIDNYDSNFPLWVIIELFTMGEISFFYSDMLTQDKKEFSKKIFGNSDYTYKNLSSWLLCLTKLRNYCAHYSRLYFNKFGTVPATPNEFPYILKDRIYDYILVLKFLYIDYNKWNNVFLVDLENLTEEYKDVIDYNCIGFPDNWNKLLIK